MKKFVGLLISPGSIEAVQCSKTETGEITFDFYHYLGLSEPPVDEDGDITNPEALGEILAQFWKESGIKTRAVVLGLGGKRAIARLVPLPRIPANQLHQVVLSEAEQYTLFRDEEPLVDFFTVDTDTESSTVFYAAASQKLVNAYKTALKHAKLNLVALDIAQYASLRALVHFKLSDSEIWDGVIVLPGRLVITSWFGQKLLNWREVSSQRWEEEGDEQRYQFIETEISRTLRMEPGKEREILLAKGSLAESGEMSDYFQHFTDLPLMAAGIDYWCRRMPPESLAHVTPAALGLGLWGFEQRIPTLDLLHPGGSARQKNETLSNLQERFAGLSFDKSMGTAAAIAASTFVLGMGAGWYLGSIYLGGQNTTLKSENASLTSSITGLTGQLETMHKRESANKQILDLIGDQARANLSVAFITEVNEIMPADAWLLEVTSPTPETMQVKGGANSQTAGLDLARRIAEFVEVAQVSVSDLSQVETGRFEYTIDVTLLPQSTPSGTAPAGP